MQTLIEYMKESHIQTHKQVMRIRKNKKLSEMGYEGLHSAYECQLNQSPWDVISLNLLQSSDNSDASSSLEKSEGEDEIVAGVSDTINSNKQKENEESETETGKKGKLRLKKSEKDEKKCVHCQKIEWFEGGDHCCCCLKFSICSEKKHEKRLRRNFLAIKRQARQANKLQVHLYPRFIVSWTDLDQVDLNC